MRGRPGPTLLAAVLLGAGVLITSHGCEPGPDQPAAASAARPAMVRTYRAGDPAKPDLTVRLMIDRTQITPADSLRLTIEAAGVPGSAVTLPEVGEKLGDFTVASATHEPPLGTSTPSDQRRQTLVLEPFLGGKKVVPALQISATIPGAERPTTIRTEPIDIDVRSVLGAQDAASSLEPAKPPVAVGSTGRDKATRWLAVGLGGASIAVLAGLWIGAWLVGSRSRRMVIDAAQAARLELDALAQALDGPSQSNDTAAICAGLSAALRRFVQRRFGIPAASWSLEQIRRAPWPRTRPDAAELHAELHSLLSQLDALRFAPGAPERPNVRILLERARAWLGRVAEPVVGFTMAEPAEAAA